MPAADCRAWRGQRRGGARHGAGALAHSPAEVAVAVTGIAGPAGAARQAGRHGLAGLLRRGGAVQASGCNSTATGPACARKPWTSHCSACSRCVLLPHDDSRRLPRPAQRPFRCPRTPTPGCLRCAPPGPNSAGGPTTTARSRAMPSTPWWSPTPCPGCWKACRGCAWRNCCGPASTGRSPTPPCRPMRPGAHGRADAECGDGRDGVVGHAVAAARLLRIRGATAGRCLAAIRATAGRRHPGAGARPGPDGMRRRVAPGGAGLSRQWLAPRRAIDAFFYRCSPRGR